MNNIIVFYVVFSYEKLLSSIPSYHHTAVEYNNYHWVEQTITVSLVLFLFNSTHSLASVYCHCGVCSVVHTQESEICLKSLSFLVGISRNEHSFTKKKKRRKKKVWNISQDMDKRASREQKKKSGIKTIWKFNLYSLITMRRKGKIEQKKKKKKRKDEKIQEKHSRKL